MRYPDRDQGPAQPDGHTDRWRSSTVPILIGTVLAVILVVGLVVGVAMSWRGGGAWPPMRGDMQDMPHGGVMSRDGDATSRAPAPLPDAATIEITAGDLFFRPDTIEIVASEPVNLTVTNEGRVFHDLTVPELDLQIDVEPGTTSTAGLEIELPGRYEYVCTVPGHSTGGMRGTLVVLPATESGP